MYLAKMPSDRGILSIHVIVMEVSLKFRFCYDPDMIACFHEHHALELWKWKNHEDSNFDSQLLSEQLLTMKNFTQKLYKIHLHIIEAGNDKSKNLDRKSVV